jgi:hypothetical protein
MPKKKKEGRRRRKLKDEGSKMKKEGRTRGDMLREVLSGWRDQKQGG